VRLSIRLCPAADSHAHKEIIVKKLTENVPYGAKVTVVGDHSGNGWSMKELQPWFTDGIQ